MLAIRPVRLTVSSPVHVTWTERIEGRCPNIGREIDDIKFGVLARCYSPDDGRDFTWMTIEADCGSDFASPPLWKNSGSPISPIAQYQQEMLDMAPDESESDYEPSLKDIVVSSARKGKEDPLQNKFGRPKEAEKPTAAALRKFSRTESMDRGVFLLKIFSPFPSRPRRSSSFAKTSTKLSPKPESTERCKVEKIRGSHERCNKGDGGGNGDNNKTNNISRRRRILGRLRTFLRKSYSSYHSRS